MIIVPQPTALPLGFDQCEKPSFLRQMEARWLQQASRP